MRWRAACGKFTGGAPSNNTCVGKGRQEDCVRERLGYDAVPTLVSADSLAISEAGMTLLSCPYLCERTGSSQLQVNQSAAPGRGMTLDKMAFLSEAAGSLQLSLGNKTLGPEGETGWHSIPD